MVQLFAIGSNGSGQLGIGHQEDVSVPKQVLFGEGNPIPTSIRAGGNHSLLLSSGALYSCGDPSSGACGLTSESEKLFQFRQTCFPNVTSLPNVPHVAWHAASWEASIIILSDENGVANQVYTFGIGNKGELGQGELLFRSAEAHLIKDFPPKGLEVVDLAASVSHVVAVLDNGEVYGWGNGRKGQLGQPEGIIYAPRKITGLEFKVIRAVCGRDFTYFLGEAVEGKNIVLGSDKCNISSGAPSAAPGWKDVGASWGSIFILHKDGSVLSWGRNDHGQLAPSDLPSILQIAVGSEHALGLTPEGDVLAWGWGEHGNCGPSMMNGHTTRMWNTIASSKYLPPGSKISGIGAGCATSWVFVDD